MLNKSLQRFFVVLVALLAAMPLVYTFAQSPVPAGSSIELVGMVEAMTADTLTVNGQMVNIANAEIKTTLALNLAVKVEGIIQSDGSIVAREVQLAEHDVLPGELEIVGAVENIDAASLVVGGLTFDITAAQVQAGIALGDVVKVHASLTGTGTWVAREVELVGDMLPEATPSPDVTPEPGKNHDGEIEFVGTLEQLGTTSIVVSGLTIDIARAEIEGMLVEGALVKVEAWLSDSGTWIAHEVKMLGIVLAGPEVTPSPESTPDPSCTPSHPAGWVAYVVQPGDTIGSLARLLGIDDATLAAANCVTDPLTPGSVIYGPAYGHDSYGHDSGDDHGNGRGDSSSDSHDDDSRDDHSDRGSRSDDHHDDSDDDHSDHGGKDHDDSGHDD